MLRKAMILLEDTLKDNRLSSNQLYLILEKYIKFLEMLKNISDRDSEQLSVVAEGVEGFMNLLELSRFFNEQ